MNLRFHKKVGYSLAGWVTIRFSKISWTLEWVSK